MDSEASQAWRKQGDVVAFDHGAWEFHSRQFLGSAKQLLQIHDAAVAHQNFDSITALSTATFLLSLAIEQVSKAYYLKSKRGPRESIYTHSVADLCGEKLLDGKGKQLMAYAEAFVVWAGRYPTPKWTKEQFKEAYDVPCKIIDGLEHIDAEKLPNSTSRARTDELLAQYKLIHEAWQAAA
jgi:hypothetical protein